MRKLWAPWALALAGGGAWGWLSAEPAPSLTFLAVGQGDCAVFQAQNTAILFDVGPKSEYVDAGERIVLPELRRMGVDSVSLIVLSHPDSDHVGGLAAVWRRFPQARVAASAAFRRHPGFLQAIKSCGRDPEQILWVEPAARVVLGRFTVDLACPDWQPGDDDNDGSIFARISGDGASAVLTGDAPQSVEEREIAKGAWAAQVLKAGHHGSNGASSDAWLRAVRPGFVVISCGRGNRYGHPHADALKRIERIGARVFRTDRDGSVAFEVGPRGFHPVADGR